MSAADSTTVDWTGWLTATPEQQQDMLRRYREIIKAESDEARATNYARMNAALRTPAPLRTWGEQP